MTVARPSETVAKRKRKENLEHARAVRSVRSFGGAPLRQSDSQKLIALAIEIIQDERASIVSSFEEHDGKVRDYDARALIRRYDRFLKPARAYVGKQHVK
jgi:hypothetical protein